MAFSAFTYPSRKLPAPHGRHSTNDHQSKYSGIRPSTKVIPATDVATGTSSGSAESAKVGGRGNTEDSETLLSYLHWVSGGTALFQSSSPQPHDPRATSPNSGLSNGGLSPSPPSISSSLSANSGPIGSPTCVSCSACQQPIFGEPFRVLGDALHPNCVRCVVSLLTSERSSTTEFPITLYRSLGLQCRSGI